MWNDEKKCPVKWRQVKWAKIANVLLLLLLEFIRFQNTVTKIGAEDFDTSQLHDNVKIKPDKFIKVNFIGKG